MKEEPWLKQYWRPLMAYQYLLVCLFDFIIAPSLTMLLAKYHIVEYKQWDPITLKESGYYHMAMGAILGVAAWTRGMEKIKRLDLLTGQMTEVDTENVQQKPVKTTQSTETEKPSRMD